MIFLPNIGLSVPYIHLNEAVSKPQSMALSKIKEKGIHCMRFLTLCMTFLQCPV